MTQKNPIQLGFAEPVSFEEVHEILPPSSLPSKIGGTPTWLDPRSPLSVDSLLCGICEFPMTFLMQIYTPEDAPDDPAFHRMVHVFCCKQGKCHVKDWKQCFRVYRSQLPRVNPVWSEEPNEEGEYVPASEAPAKSFKAAPTCEVCNLAASKVCSKCHLVRYCSKAHQALHWSAGLHRKLCDVEPEERAIDMLESEQRALSDIGFPVFEIVSEPEEDEGNEDEEKEEGEDDEDQDEKRTKTTTKDLVQFNANDEGYEKTEVDVDTPFLKFQKRIARCPEQVLRYVRVCDEEILENDDNSSEADEGVDEVVERMEEEGKDCTTRRQKKDKRADPLEPLWVSEMGKPKVQTVCVERRSDTNRGGVDEEEVIELAPEWDVPCCEQCSEPRELEFQILPQMLNHLPINHADPDALDWGTLLVYTCPKNCLSENASERYTREILWRQDFSEDGIGGRLRNAGGEQADA